MSSHRPVGFLSPAGSFLLSLLWFTPFSCVVWRSACPLHNTRHTVLRATLPMACSSVKAGTVPALCVLMPSRVTEGQARGGPAGYSQSERGVRGPSPSGRSPTVNSGKELRPFSSRPHALNTDPASSGSPLPPRAGTIRSRQPRRGEPNSTHRTHGISCVLKSVTRLSHFCARLSD